MTTFNHFELRRLSSDVIYQFDRATHPNGQMAYKRRDKDLWIIFLPELGWIAWNEGTQDVGGRPWHIAPDAQSEDHPPEGEWVSKKGAKSYVYELKYVTPSTQI